MIYKAVLAIIKTAFFGYNRFCSFTLLNEAESYQGYRPEMLRFKTITLKNVKWSVLNISHWEKM
jgi:hypothetical protein